MCFLGPDCEGAAAKVGFVKKTAFYGLPFSHVPQALGERCGHFPPSPAGLSHTPPFMEGISPCHHQHASSGMSPGTFL